MMDPASTTSESGAQRLIMRGGASAGLGLIFRLGARVVFMFVAARLFGAAAFGAYSLAVATVELAVAISGLGMKRYLFKLLEERGEHAAGHVLTVAAPVGQEDVGHRRLLSSTSGAQGILGCRVLWPAAAPGTSLPAPAVRPARPLIPPYGINGRRATGRQR